MISLTGKGVPVILLLFNAGPLNISWADQSPDVAAIMECFFPAQATGEALRRVILNDGEGAVPAARLPVTWPMTASQVTSTTCILGRRGEENIVFTLVQCYFTHLATASFWV